MNDRVFLDTNIIIYLYSKFEADKRNVAYDIVNKFNCFISTQTMNEAVNIWFKKYQLTQDIILKYLDELETVCEKVMIIHRDTINRALEIKIRYGFTFYDCLILSSSIEADCGILFSEDMNDGQIINGILKISNPFKGI